MTSKYFTYDNLTPIEAKQKCEDYNKKFVTLFNKTLADTSKFKTNCETMQEMLDWVIYHIKIDNKKLNLKQIISWFLIPDTMIEISEVYENFIVKLIEYYSYCVEDAMIMVLGNQKYKIEEFANSHRMIIDKCESLGRQFAHHFNKVMDEGINSSNFNHHCKELNNFFSQINKLKFKNSNKRLSTENLLDWFFTTGQNFEDIIKEPYIEDYDRFVTYLLYHRDNYNIKEFLINLINKEFKND